MSTIDIGNLSESIVMAAYIKAGFSVSVPFGNGCAYGLVVDTGPHLYKVQVELIPVFLALIIQFGLNPLTTLGLSK